MQLEGQTALITGAGAPGGIGAATAELLASEGAKVVITGRSAAAGEVALQRLRDQGADARFVLADLSNLDDVHRLVQEAGEIDILVNNAAAITFGPTVDQDVASFEESFDVNVRAAYFLVAGLAPGMVERGRGSIISVTTMVATIGMAGMSTYGATKAAIESLTRSWAAEFGAAGVRANAVAPGPTASDKVVGMGDMIEQLAQTLPLLRPAKPSEIADAILFLASDRSSYITGTTLAADGGRTAV